MAKIITRNAVRVLSKIKSLNYDNHLNVSQNLKKQAQFQSHTSSQMKHPTC